MDLHHEIKRVKNKIYKKSKAILLKVSEELIKDHKMESLKENE